MKPNSSEGKKDKILYFYVISKDRKRIQLIKEIKPIKWSEYPPRFKIPNYGEFVRMEAKNIDIFFDDKVHVIYCIEI